MKRHLLSRLVCGVLSRPAWARGLKPNYAAFLWYLEQGRAPRGRVD